MDEKPGRRTPTHENAFIQKKRSRLICTRLYTYATQIKQLFFFFKKKEKKSYIGIPVDASQELGQSLLVLAQIQAKLPQQVSLFWSENLGRCFECDESELVTVGGRIKIFEKGQGLLKISTMFARTHNTQQQHNNNTHNTTPSAHKNTHTEWAGWA